MNLEENKKQVLAWLSGRGIPFELYEHERARTIDDCLAMPFIGEDVTICKNIMLCSRQKTSFYLLLLRPHTPFRTAVVSKSLGVSRLSFAPLEALEERLHVSSGSVSPLGLVFDTAHEIPLCYEPGICNTPRIAFHPCDNAATLIFTQQAFWQGVVPALGARTIAVRADQCES